MGLLEGLDFLLVLVVLGVQGINYLRTVGQGRRGGLGGAVRMGAESPYQLFQYEINSSTVKCQARREI